MDNNSITTLDKQTFVTLANAFISDEEYLNDLYRTKKEIAEKHGVESDFVGDDIGFLKTQSAVLDALGIEFSYWLYDCNKDFELFNKNVTQSDGKHPSLHSLEDLWEFSQPEEE